MFVDEMVRPALPPHRQAIVVRDTKDKKHALAEALRNSIVGIDIGKNSFHVVGLDGHPSSCCGRKWSWGKMEGRFANMPPCLIGMEAYAKDSGHSTLFGIPLMHPYSLGLDHSDKARLPWA